MRVPFSYLDRQFVDIEPVIDGIRDLVRTGDFTLGAAVSEFETRFAKLAGVGHAIGVGSGTDALLLALQAVGVRAGDEVITTANTFIATVGAIVAAGARPVFIDINDEHNLDVARLEAAITPRTRAILPVHLWGSPADMPAILAIGQRRGLAVVEDACQAFTAAIGGRPVGSFGAAGGFSLHPLKALNVWGDGGVIVTDDAALADHLRLRRNHGLRDRDTVEIFGVNTRLHTLQAIVGNHYLDQVIGITDQRIENARRLDAGLRPLGDALRIPPYRAGVRHIYHHYVVHATRRDALVRFLRDRGVDAKVHYPLPVHLQAPCRALGYREGDFPKCERFAQEIVTLPAHQHLTTEELDYEVAQVREFYGR